MRSYRTPEPDPFRPPTVNRGMTADRPKRPRRRVENDEYNGFLERVLAAHGRRVAAGDIEGLAALKRLGDRVDDAIRVATAGLIQHGYSWTDIGRVTEVSRQAAWKRWGRS